MGGRRRITDPKEITKPKLPQPLVELVSIAETNQRISVDKMFELVLEFASERRKHHESIEERERLIRAVYENEFTEPERVHFLAKLYNRFAEKYDQHMGVDTGHYQAIERVLGYAKPYLNLPIIDLSAGTGEPMKLAIKTMGMKTGFRIESDLTYLIHLNEVSAKMLEIAEGKLGNKPRVGFSDYSALTMPDHLKGRFQSVLCSQTFHIISDKDKPGLVDSMRELLVQGGHAVVIEEDPFRITETPSIEAVTLFLRSVVAPIRPVMLIGMFETNGFTKLEDRAVAPIDDKHSMRVHIFQKN
jgi:ubiquinone/menaquinone biosynthesis C-methylase UbiE